MKETIATYFLNLEDPRSLRHQKHSLISLIGTSLLAALSGIDRFSGIQDFIDMHFDSLSEYFDFPHRVPSHDTYQRLWDAIAPSQFQACFSDFIASLEKVTSDMISLDGKTIRNSDKEKAAGI